MYVCSTLGINVNSSQLPSRRLTEMLLSIICTIRYLDLPFTFDSRVSSAARTYTRKCTSSSMKTLLGTNGCNIQMFFYSPCESCNTQYSTGLKLFCDWSLYHDSQSHYFI